MSLLRRVASNTLQEHSAVLTVPPHLLKLERALGMNPLVSAPDLSDRRTKPDRATAMLTRLLTLRVRDVHVAPPNARAYLPERSRTEMLAPLGLPTGRPLPYANAYRIEGARSARAFALRD